MPTPGVDKGDITKGKVSKDGKILSWKSDVPIDKEAELLEYSFKKQREVAKESNENGVQKSPNIELSQGNYFDDSAPRDIHTKQKDLKMERKWTRSEKEKINPVQPPAPEDDLDIAV